MRAPRPGSLNSQYSLQLRMNALHLGICVGQLGSHLISGFYVVDLAAAVAAEAWPGNLLDMQILRPCARATKQETLEVGPSNL